MELKVTNKSNIGTHFVLDNIFLGTIMSDTECTKETLREKARGIAIETIDKLVDSNIITSEEVDVFYKTENGYVRFIDTGSRMYEEIVEESRLKNIVPITDYYKKENLVELETNGMWIIAVMKDEPLHKYNEDYNKT